MLSNDISTNQNLSLIGIILKWSFLIWELIFLFIADFFFFLILVVFVLFLLQYVKKRILKPESVPEKWP